MSYVPLPTFSVVNYELRSTLGVVSHELPWTASVMSCEELSTVSVVNDDHKTSGSAGTEARPVAGRTHPAAVRGGQGALDPR